VTSAGTVPASTSRRVNVIRAAGPAAPSTGICPKWYGSIHRLPKTPLTQRPMSRPPDRRQGLHVCLPGGVIHDDVDLFVADPVGSPLLAIPGHPPSRLAGPRQGLDVDRDQVARPLPLVALYRWFGLPGSAVGPGRSCSGFGRRWRRVPAGDGRCAAGAIAGDAGPRPARSAREAAPPDRYWASQRR
jgi:hypothetical protein